VTSRMAARHPSLSPVMSVFSRKGIHRRGATKVQLPTIPIYKNERILRRDEFLQFPASRHRRCAADLFLTPRNRVESIVCELENSANGDLLIVPGTRSARLLSIIANLLYLRRWAHTVELRSISG